MQASPPTGYLEIERALRLLPSGDSDIWIASRLHGVDHPAAIKAATLLRQGCRQQAQAMLEDTLRWRGGYPMAMGSPGSAALGCDPQLAREFPFAIAQVTADPPGWQHDGRGSEVASYEARTAGADVLLPHRQIDALYRPNADREQLGDSLDPHAGAAQLDDAGLHLAAHPGAAQLDPGSLGPGEAAVDPLDDDRALELGNTPSIWNMARPDGVLVSSACWCRNRSTPAARNSCRAATRSCTLRPRRSTDHAASMA